MNMGKTIASLAFLITVTHCTANRITGGVFTALHVLGDRV